MWKIIESSMKMQHRLGFSGKFLINKFCGFVVAISSFIVAYLLQPTRTEQSIVTPVVRNMELETRREKSKGKCLICCIRCTSNCIYVCCCCCVFTRLFMKEPQPGKSLLDLIPTTCLLKQTSPTFDLVEPQTFWQPQVIPPQLTDQPKPSAPDASELCEISISDQFGEGFIVHETSSGVYVLPHDFFSQQKPVSPDLNRNNYPLNQLWA